MSAQYRNRPEVVLEVKEDIGRFIEFLISMICHFFELNTMYLSLCKFINSSSGIQRRTNFIRFNLFKPLATYK